MSSPIRWGILGTGAIAKKFAKGLASIPDAQMAAVGSRAQDTADAFAAEFGFARAHGSYQALVRDGGVDVIYISTPHQLHCENTLLCLDHGKAVLCEKPFAVNARDARRMVGASHAKKLFLMEAMWTRFIPAMVQVREWIADGRIGEPRMVMADFGFRADLNHDSRLFNPEYAGGGLLDVGVYPISFAAMVFGATPTSTSGIAHLGETGVDEQAGITLGYDGGKMAVLACGVRTETPHEAYVLGTEGSIRVPAPFWCSTSAILNSKGHEPITFSQAHQGNGYEYQAMEVMRCIREDKLESDIMSLDDTVAIMETMDRLRAQWGIRYPME